MSARKQDSVTKARSRDTVEGAASISSQNPVSQLTEVAFPAGAEVEVKINSKGFYGSWYEAKVLNRFTVTRCVKYKVQYLHLSEDDGQKLLVEDVHAKNVRPRAPRRLSTQGGGKEDEDPNIKMHDLVEAYHSDGWWHGVVSGIRNPATGLYTVSFPNSREVFQFKPAEIRPQLAYVDGKWVPVLGEAQQKKETFKEGDKVEVYQLRDDYGPSYFPARVEKVIHKSYYLVKYESLNARPNGDLTEILDSQYLRPAVDYMPGTNRFMVDSHVEVFYKGGWSPGVVLSGLSSSNYAVTVESKGEPMTVHFNVSNMRLRLDWNGRRWSKWGSPFKGKKRKTANPNKIFTFDVSLTEKSETTPDSGTSTGKKLKKEQPVEVQELQSPLGNIFIPSCIRKDLESDDEVPITLRVKLEPSNNTISSSPRIRHAVQKTSQSHKLLTELKDCHSKISTRKRSNTCERKTKGWVTDKKQDEVNHNRQTTSEKQKDVNLSNESSSDVPQPNTNGEKSASCQQKLSSNTNYTADCSGENAIGASSHDSTVGHIVGSDCQCLLNTQDSFTEGVAEISKGQLVDSQPLNSSATMEHLTGIQGNISNPSLSRPVSSVDQAAPLSLLENSVLTEPNPNSKFNNHTLAEHTPVKSVTSDILLPFEKTSHLWKTLETTLEVFRQIPQTPHFMKLESECKDKREGEAIGLMMTYSILSDSIQRLSIHTAAKVFEEKIACLECLEENGFIVDPIRSRLQQLVDMKKDYTESSSKRVELETEFASEEKKSMSLHASANAHETELEDIRKSIAELQERGKALMDEKAGKLGLAAKHEHNMSRLRENILSIDRSNELAPEEFKCLISKPLQEGGI
ncbi:hypothetical protein FCM35_KLT10877 [Carex littledalei]|uniref:Agenet domain-containing protein n=1 Tax=Carex littledalei TaxID=544730 RepID=A0A833VFY3_9POAL|nr:hypothetical protein FCM35_KLT10877 [Carex littledalei]